MRILYVEDHDDTASAMARLLLSYGHAVSTAATAVEAERLCDDEDFDLLILDIGLRDGDGCALLERLRKKCATPAIALTGYGMPEDIVRTRAAGFLAHILKPVTLEPLLEMIQSVAATSHSSCGL
jgi:CheY-like chemotaxis protein